MGLVCIHTEQTQRRLRLILFVTSITSVVLSFISIQRCNFIESGVPSLPDEPAYSWGLFTAPVYDQERNIQGCIPYPNSMELGTTMKTAQAFGIFLTITVTAIFLALSLVQLFVEHGTKTIYHVIRVALPCAFGCQLLTFSAFASKFCSEVVDDQDEQHGTMAVTCVPGTAGVIAIFNLVAMIVMMIVMTMVSPPEHPMFQWYGTGNSVQQVVRRRRRKNSRRGGRDGDEKKRKNKSQQGNKKPTPHTDKHKYSKVKQPQSSSQRQRQRQPVEQFTMMEPHRPGKEKVKTTIVNGPDVRKTIREITHPDGSQTITTTVEELRPTTIVEDDYDYHDIEGVGMDGEEEYGYESSTLEEEEEEEEESTILQVL